MSLAFVSRVNAFGAFTGQIEYAVVCLPLGVQRVQIGHMNIGLKKAVYYQHQEF